jgi:hypothetical protein
MTSRDFCYWLQGYFEIAVAPIGELDKNQIDCIQKHLALVFKHEIDPSAGSYDHQVVLNEIHDGIKTEKKRIMPHARDNIPYRC